MVLANGQYMFTDPSDGAYELEIPLDENGEITLFGFCDGLQPFKRVLDESGNEVDSDGDGYTPSEGDCNDNDAGIYPEAEEICDDGIDQDCRFGDCLSEFTITGGIWYGATDRVFVSFRVSWGSITGIRYGDAWIDTQIEKKIQIDNNEFYMESSSTVITGRFIGPTACEVTYRGETFLVTFLEE